MSTLYSDFDLSFDRDPLSGDLKTVADEHAVTQSVKALVLTSLYERPFQPSIGSVIYQLLFEPMTEIVKMLLAQSIRDVVNSFEPRATVKYVDVILSGLDDHDITVEVGFTVYNRPSLVTTSISLRRIR